MSEGTWDDFVAWAGQVAGTTDLNALEHDYKREVARELAVAQSQFLAGSDAWGDSLGDALGKTNLLHWMTVSKLKKASHEQPQAMSDAVAVIWASDGAHWSSIDEVGEHLKVAMPEISPGNITALGSLLLMSTDAERFPPYRAEPVKQWSSLVGLDPPGASPSQRYLRLLELCDGLLERTSAASSPLEAQGLAFAVMKGAHDELGLSGDQFAQLQAWRGDKAPVASPGRGQACSPAMEAAAWIVLGRGLRGESSPITEGPTAWTAETAADLATRMSADPGTGGFLDRIGAQLEDAADATKLLAAELIYLVSVLPSDLKPETKAKRVEPLLERMESAPRLPQQLRAGVEASGAFRGGMGWNSQTASSVQWLAKFVGAWAHLTAAQREEALTDPMAFAKISRLVAPGASPSIEPALNYLAWPGFHSPVVSSQHRRQIRDAFASEIGGASGQDQLAVTQDLMEIRKVHEEATGGGYAEWYGPPYVDAWRPSVGTSQRAWLVRPHPGDRRLVDRWLKERFVSLKAEHLRTVEPGAELSAIQNAVDAGYQHIDYAQRATLTTEYHAFLTSMSPGDVVATVIEGEVHVGVIEEDAAFIDDSMARLQRSVDWGPRSYALESLQTLGAQQGTVVDVTGSLDALATLLEDEEVEPLVDDAQVDLLPVTEGLADRLHMPRAGLQEIVDVLQDRKQIVLYGPPGTGKTYLAKHLAEFLVGEDDTSRARLVQFHPSYSYEDFFEGYRPSVSEQGQAIFTLTSGPLRQLSAAAEQAENRSQPFVLIIDEMNRANLAKVFGELYFLLEYRDESIRLQYSPDKPFRLPPNLFIIATMNTADRSIAMVDAAIRRRFAFLEMHPGEEPVSGVLSAYLKKSGRSGELAELLDALNAEIGEDERDLQIGPSYLMRESAETKTGLERIWRFDILPLLEEHYYGRFNRSRLHERFGLDALRRRLLPQPEQDDGVDQDGEPEPHVAD